MIVKWLTLLQISQPFLLDTVLEGVTGSTAYGISNDNSDMDVYGICMIPLEMAFPHRTGHIRGFGVLPPNFEVMNQHHIVYKEKEYDVAIYSVVKFFQLAAENNPNIVDFLFLPKNCMRKETEIGKHILANRSMFLNKNSMHKFLGYAYSQIQKLKTKVPIGSRLEIVKKFGYDVKFASHCVRLALECEQILTEGTLDLQKNKDIVKSVKEGHFKSVGELEDWFKAKEAVLQQIYVQSKLPYTADWNALRELLLQCFEMKYGNINEMKNEVILYREKLEK